MLLGKSVIASSFAEYILLFSYFIAKLNTKVRKFMLDQCIKCCNSASWQ